jgi:hypothetical protein
VLQLRTVQPYVQRRLPYLPVSTHQSLPFVEKDIASDATSISQMDGICQLRLNLLSNSHFGKLRALSALTGTGSGSRTVAPGDRSAP